MRTSRLQARWLSRLGNELHYEVQPGPSDAIRWPGHGPFDERLGYSQLPQRIDRLRAAGYSVAAQARQSPRMLALHDQGLFTIYPEKSQAGLSLQDCRGQPMYALRSPERVYDRFEAVPRLLVDSLLFIENRELLDPRQARRNPAVEWDRLARAVWEQARRKVDDSAGSSGGSTLATQIEKYRHSPEGRTDSAREKLRQMASASLRAYAGGENTMPRRRQIVVDYLNTVPLAAQAGVGEVNGLGDGLWAWYGRDFDEVNRLLAAGGELKALALAYKQALSLMIAQRRPSYYLVDGEANLATLTDRHLRLLATAGIISPSLRDAALATRLALTRPPARQPLSFIDRKATTALRTRLSGLLGMPRAYELDRIDLVASSTLDADLQRAAAQLIGGLQQPAGARAAGLYGEHLLRDGDDPRRLSFSFTLYERTEQANLLRVQTDNLDQPFDINEGARLDLGSTAKLRTLVTYLQIVAELHGAWAGLSAAELAALPVAPRDRLAQWSRDHLRQSSDKRLMTMLEAAMARRYSASPGETFFTGGGEHVFENFEPEDNSRIMSVHEALQRSVNLVFIRLMRDVVYHLQYQHEQANAQLLDDPTDPRRKAYLARFADQEGREYLTRFYAKYRGKSAFDAQALLLQSLLGPRTSAQRLAAAFFGLAPQGTPAQLAQFLDQHLPPGARGFDRAEGATGEYDSAAALYERFGPGRLPLSDRGYLARVHPLELWLVGYLSAHPGATWSDVVGASTAERQEVYAWLFRTRFKSAQDSRLRTLLEQEAFQDLQRRWKALGYSFDDLTPSYATALGASGDRPAALAELMGLIVNGGVRKPMLRLPLLQFAPGTPYESWLSFQPPAQEERLLPAELTVVVRRALIDVVAKGTARRLQGALRRADGGALDIGGKTGTGDHRFDTYGRGGQLISSRVVNRTATLVFLIGDRWFGTLMAYVHEPYAADYKFTSALPAQLLKALVPVLQPVVDAPGCSAQPEPLLVKVGQ